MHQASDSLRYPTVHLRHLKGSPMVKQKSYITGYYLIAAFECIMQAIM